jgi:hypothetical protein
MFIRIASMQASGQVRATIAARLAACTNRPRVQAYPRPVPRRDEMVQQALARINRNCLTGARDAALLLTFLMTG